MTRTYTLTAPKTPGAEPTIIATGTLAQLRGIARDFQRRTDLTWQDVRINNADGSRYEYIGPIR